MPQKNEIYQKINDFNVGLAALITSIDEIITKQNNHNTQSLQSLIKLQEELTKIKNGYHQLLPVYEHDDNSAKILAHSDKYISSCKEAIYKHQSKIMAAPELWNQISSKINNFLEKYLHVKPLKVKSSEYKASLDSGFEKVQRFRSLKDEYTKGKEEGEELDSNSPSI